MADTADLVVYTLEYCPNCEALKEYLIRHQLTFEERDMSTAESLTELRINGVFVNEAPVLKGAGGFLTSSELFAKGVLQEAQVRKLAEGP